MDCTEVWLSHLRALEVNVYVVCEYMKRYSVGHFFGGKIGFGNFGGKPNTVFPIRFIYAYNLLAFFNTL